MLRKEFLNKSGIILGLGALIQVLERCAPTSINPKPSANFTVDLTSSANSTLKTVGGYILTQGIYIICTGPSTYIALSSICTHQGCQVNYNASVKQFVCPCHGGVYGMTGKVISGPPPSALAQYQVTLNGTTLSISG